MRLRSDWLLACARELLFSILKVLFGLVGSAVLLLLLISTLPRGLYAFSFCLGLLAGETTLLTVIHEFGHAVPALLVTQGDVTMHVGAGYSPVRRQTRAGRLRIVVRPPHWRVWRRLLRNWGGFVEHSQTTRWGTALIVLGGSGASVITLVLCGYLAYKSAGSNLDTGLSLWALLWVFIAGGALRQVIGSVIPRRGAVFMPGLKDDPNDALILVNVLRLAQAEVRPSLPVREGTLPFKDFNVWYRIVGDQDEPGRLPLLVLHGGPGLPHQSVQPLEMLATAGRRVVFYDQLGCGNSDRPDDASLYSLDLFVEEIDSVRRALGLEQIHLWGTGWGSVLALQYVLGGATGVASLVLTDATARMPQSTQDLEPMYRLLPSRVGQVLRDWHEGPVKADAEARMHAWRFVQTRYLCRLSPWPDYLMEALATFGRRVNQAIIAPRALLPTGPLKDWNVEDRLGEIDVPTLVVKSRHELSLDAAKRVHQGIVGSKMVTFRHSSSMPYTEEAWRYRRVVSRFLDQVDRRQ